MLQTVFKLTSANSPQNHCRKQLSNPLLQTAFKLTAENSLLKRLPNSDSRFFMTMTMAMAMTMTMTMTII